MPKYRFPITGPTGKTVDDETGVFFDDDENACLYGSQVIAELKSDPNDDFTGWSMEIKTDDRVVAVLPFNKPH